MSPCNTTTKRFPRTSLAEPWRGVIEHHRAPLPQRLAGWLGMAGVLALFAGIGCLLAWRG